MCVKNNERVVALRTEGGLAGEGGGLHILELQISFRREDEDGIPSVAH